MEEQQRRAAVRELLAVTLRSRGVDALQNAIRQGEQTGLSPAELAAARAALEEQRKAIEVALDTFCLGGSSQR